MRRWRGRSQSMTAYRSSSSIEPSPRVSVSESRAVASAELRAMARLRTRIEHAVAFGRALPGDESVQAQTFERAEYGGDVVAGAGAQDVESLVAPNKKFVLERSAAALKTQGQVTKSQPDRPRSSQPE